MEIVLVQKAGPLRSLNFNTGWLYLVGVLICLLLAGLVVCGLLLYHQYEKNQQHEAESQALKMHILRLEDQVQESEKRLLQSGADSLRQASAAPKAEAEKPEEPAGTSQKGQTKSNTSPENQTSNADVKSSQTGDSKADAAKSETDPPQDSQILLAEPRKSEIISLRNIKRKKARNSMNIRFEVANSQGSDNPLVGYASVIARGHKSGKIWVESFPRMELTLLGRPVNYRRGIPFSIKRYRRIDAKFPTKGKKFDRLEIVVYSKEGKLLLVHFENM